MTKYQVTIEEKVYRTINVNAENAAEAEKKAVATYDNDDLSAFIISDWSINSISTQPLPDKSKKDSE